MEHLIEFQNWAQVIDASLNGIYVHDLNLGRHVFINRQYTTLTGYTHDDLQGMDKEQFFALVHPDDRQRMAEHLDQLIGGSREMLEIEYRFKTKDGSWIWCLSRDGAFAFNADGSLAQFIGTILDITKHKQTEEALNQVNNDLEIMIEERTAELQKAIRRLQEENQQRIRTEQALKLEEARLEALLTLSRINAPASLKEVSSFILEQAIKLTHSKIGFVGFLNEDESVYTLHAVSKEVVKECRVVGDPLQWHVADAGIWADAIHRRETLFINDYSRPHPGKKGLPPGHPPIDRFMVVPVFAQGRIVAVAGVGNKSSAYDASDERQIALLLNGMWCHVQRTRSKEELQLAYNDMEEKVKQRTEELAVSTTALQERQKDFNRAQEVGQIGSWRMDIRRNALIWSDENHRIFGIPKGTALTYESFLEIVHPDDRREVDARWKASLCGEPYDLEHRVLVDGQLKWLREKAYLEFDDAGEVQGSFGITQDITERKQAEENLRQAKDTSEALNRINEVLHATLDFDEIMRRIVAVGSALLGNESAVVALRNGHGWIVNQAHGISTDYIGTRLKDDQLQQSFLALQSRRPVAVDDAFGDHRVNREYMLRHNIRSMLVAPLILRNEELGVIHFNYHSARHTFTDAELDFAKQMAAIAGIALANARLFDARKAAEDEVRRANLELEQRVMDRTAEIEAQYKELQELNIMIKGLSDKTIQAMESDRRVLSKEIHDSIGGTLAALKLQLEARMSRMDPLARDLPSDLMPFEKIVAYLAEAIKETKRISWQLRSLTLDDFGLTPALAEHIGRFEQFYPGLKVISLIETADKDIPAKIQTVLYRVVQEALNNVGRHSNAVQVRIHLSNAKNRVHLEIEDNGCGFDLQKALSGPQSLTSFGVHSMRQRVEICKGDFQIHSAPGEGTVVRVSIPM